MLGSHEQGTVQRHLFWRETANLLRHLHLYTIIRGGGIHRHVTVLLEHTIMLPWTVKVVTAGYGGSNGSVPGPSWTRTVPSLLSYR
jgi:hypothetical protein